MGDEECMFGNDADVDIAMVTQRKTRNMTFRTEISPAALLTVDAV
jgi:hypothetical protein